MSELREHSCIWSCLVCTADAQSAGQWNTIHGLALPVADRTSAPLLPAACKQHYRKQKERSCQEADETDRESWANSWPQLESEESLKQVCGMCLLCALVVYCVLCRL